MISSRKTLLALALALSSFTTRADEGAAQPRPFSVTELKKRLYDDVEAYFEHFNRSVEVRGVVVEIGRCRSCPAGTKCKPCKDHFVLGDGKGRLRLEICGLPSRPAKPGRDPRPGEVVRVTGILGNLGGGCPEQRTFAALRHEKTLDATGRRVLLGSDFVVAVERPVDVQFREAVEKGDVPRATALLDQGANIESQFYAWEKSPLGDAALRGDVPMIELLLQRGARIEARGDARRTPLATAIFSGKEEAALLLLEAGANPNVVDSDGEAAIMLAARRGTAAMARMLLAKGADKNARVDSGPGGGQSRARWSRCAQSPPRELVTSKTRLSREGPNEGQVTTGWYPTPGCEKSQTPFAKIARSRCSSAGENVAGA